VGTRARTILLLGVLAAFVWASASGARAVCQLSVEGCGGNGPSIDDLWWLPSSPGVWSYDNNWELHSIGSNMHDHPTSPGVNFLGYYLHFGYAAGAANTDSTDDIASLQVNGLDFGSGTNTVTISSGSSLTVARYMSVPSSYIQVAAGGSAYIDVQGVLSANLTNGTVGADIGINNGGIFNVNSNLSIGSLQGDSTGSVNLNANLTVGTTNLSTTFGGGINGSGSLIKTGTGTLELTGDSGYSGTTTVNGGTLLVNNVTGSGTGGGDVTVNSGATIGGTGNIGNLTVNFGATLAPGNSPGVFHVAGALSLAGTLAIQLGGTQQGQFDQVVVGFGATLSNPTLSLSLVNGFTPTFGQQFVIVQNNSPTAFGFPVDPITGSFSNGSTVMDNQGDTFVITVLPTEILLTDITAVPEPATWLLLGVGAAGSLVGRLRRRR
jgi:autotransporter-associated beta strand protein